MRLSNAAGFLLCTSIILGCLLFLLWLQSEREQDCYERGGVELIELRANICIDADGRVLR